MPSPPAAARRLNLGLTIPWTLVLTAGLGLALQRVPLEKFAFRSREALIRRGTTGAPFQPDRTYRNARSFGDLANLANDPSVRQYRPEVFTTDHRGYRNPESASRAPAAILVGESFGLGAGSRDEETLTARLSKLWGRPAYNAAGMRPRYSLEGLRALARDLEMKRGLVILLFLEHQGMPEVPRMAGTSPGRGPVAPPLESRADRLRRRVDALWRSCRIRIRAEQICRRFQNDWILPNPFRPKVAVRRLADGQPILFLPSDVKGRTARRDVGTDYFVWLRDGLEQDGLGLVVLLVPTKYSVYGPLLDPPAPGGVPGDDALERLEAALRRRGVAVVNLEALLRTRAREELVRGGYVYWRDDTHWNPRGMEIAAEELARSYPNPDAFGPRSVPSRLQNQDGEKKQDAQQARNREDH